MFSGSLKGGRMVLNLGKLDANEDEMLQLLRALKTLIDGTRGHPPSTAGVMQKSLAQP